ncbi:MULTISPECIES: carboxymuconolactone decarboxylase family protein [unclassified Pseudomonas]|uniref:carboxymuconolactone decarboxylase family protein n=1 Tax=unclassified Pseudomonas TaxID=196821 RepID=UPI000D6F4F41|nr:MULTISPECIES: carboxymuconolactone decarboxylase family protein [unclassified Pseudomonas]PWU25750.1 carboxymuconolactone decarboxylase family protein [Pseudomonas sp. RW407]
MPGIPYKPSDAAGPPDVLAPILERRGGTLLNIDRMLLHSVPFTQGWGSLLGKVRNELGLPEKLRELALCAVCGLCGAEYEMHHHGPLFLKAGGTPAQFNALRDLKSAIGHEALFNPLERAVLRLALDMTRQGRAPAGLLAQLRGELGDTRLVELVGVVATYNMVARFVVTLGVEVESVAAWT